ncbi:hypothetical protein M3201_05130 [Paenibacillus motobuensis]|uniref:hypothetical protein n=1 Tax=Paenibacillus TaxID=44249 RepID=UPI00203EAC91|nr:MULTISPECIES: hypothetical protein [Paenibacillus]MCM3039078.1 hypothetical protein [Paenibacillus lutimineralis]MCM3646182.1 hypothetical protein [Paenibacillus motobuensis]
MEDGWWWQADIIQLKGCSYGCAISMTVIPQDGCPHYKEETIHERTYPNWRPSNR